MRTTLLLTLLFIIPRLAHSQLRCQNLFAETHSAHFNIQQDIREQLDQLLPLVSEFQLFTRSKRASAKEEQQLRHEWQELQEQLKVKLEKNPEFESYLKMWIDFMRHWNTRAEEYRLLSKKEQGQLKNQFEIPISLATKHWIAFLEAPHYRRWKLGRTLRLLQMQRGTDLRLDLFLLQRKVDTLYSRWDFTRCKF